MTTDWKPAPRIGSLASMVRWLTSSFLAVLALLVLLPGQAFAHPLIEEARNAYNSAHHEHGLELLDQAEAGTDLSREDLEELLLLRAMLHRAEHHMDLAEVDLFRLAALDPSRQLGREVHPTLRRLFETVRERVPRPLRLDATAQRNGETVDVRVVVTDDAAGLTQGFRVHGRSDSSRWLDTTDATLTIPVAPNEGAEYWAEAIGPGGAVIASVGTATNPERVEASGVSADTVATGPDLTVSDDSTTTGPATGGGGGGIPDWVWIVGGVGLAVIVAAIVTVVVLTVPNDQTQLGRPSVQSLVSAPASLLRFDL